MVYGYLTLKIQGLSNTTSKGINQLSHGNDILNYVYEIYLFPNLFTKLGKSWGN